MNGNDKIPGVSAEKSDNRDENFSQQVDRRAEVREGEREGQHRQAWVKEGVRSGDQDDRQIERGHEAADKGDSAVVLPLYGDKEVPRYTGGYTVKRHGVFSRGEVASVDTTWAAGGTDRNDEDCHTVAVDAVQLEFGSLLRRTSEARAVVAEAVATAAFDYLKNQAERS